MPALQTIKFSVTQSHIGEGERWDPRGCPAALAVRGALFDCDHCSVYSYSAYVGFMGEQSHKYALSTRLQQFVDDFDEGREVEPAEFCMVLSGG